jgi:hypothetical protein
VARILLLLLLLLLKPKPPHRKSEIGAFRKYVDTVWRATSVA